MTKLLASAATLESLERIVQAYYYSPSIKAVAVSPSTYQVHNSKGPISGVWIRRRSGRYRFEQD